MPEKPSELVAPVAAVVAAPVFVAASAAASLASLELVTLVSSSHYRMGQH